MDLRTLTLGVTLALIACNSTGWDNTPFCRPNEAKSGCVCNTGDLGHEICTEDGLDYGPCICGPAPGGGSGGTGALGEGGAFGGGGDAGSGGAPS